MLISIVNAGAHFILSLHKMGYGKKKTYGFFYLWQEVSILQMISTLNGKVYMVQK